MQTSIPSLLASEAVATREATTAMARSTTSLGVWRWIGLRAMAIAEAPQPCTRSLGTVLMDARPGAAERATTTMANLPSTCVSSMVQMAAGPQSEMDRSLMLAACRQHQAAGIGVSSSPPTRAKALSSIPRNGKAGCLLRSAAPMATLEPPTSRSAT